MSTTEPITIKLGDAEVRVPAQAAARAYIERMFERSRVIELSSLQPGSPMLHVPPAIGAEWSGQGGIYAGIARGVDGKADFHVIVPSMPKVKANHEGAIERAAELEVDGHCDFELLTKAVAPICYANVPELFEKDWHWLADTQDADAGCAWLQNFGGGDQFWGHEVSLTLVRAFRRLPIR